MMMGVRGGFRWQGVPARVCVSNVQAWVCLFTACVCSLSATASAHSLRQRSSGGGSLSPNRVTDATWAQWTPAFRCVRLTKRILPYPTQPPLLQYTE